MHCVNCYLFSLPNRFICHYMFTSFQSLILEPGFCDRREAWATAAFLQIGGRQRIWSGGVCPEKVPWGPAWFQSNSERLWLDLPPSWWQTEVNLWEWAVFAPTLPAPTCRLEGNWLRQVWKVSYLQGLTKGARRPQQRWPPEVQISLGLPVGETALFRVSELETRILSGRATRSLHKHW